jgi:hypothetical protein
VPDASSEGNADCAPNSLRDLGWAQGCLLTLNLPLHWIAVGKDGRPIADREVHGKWLVASQDCELAWTDGNSDVATIELRPVYTESPPQDWGIRSNKLLFATSEYLDAQSPRLMVVPRVLSECTGDGHIHVNCPPVLRVRAIKTWLGYRYDRPAVPGRFVHIHQGLAMAVKKGARKQMSIHVRDVLVRYADSEGSVPIYELVAVLPSSETDEGQAAITLQGELESWLTDVALSVRPEVGVASRIVALPADSVSLAFIESAFAIDAADLSWPRKGGDVTGASR